MKKQFCTAALTAVVAIAFSAVTGYAQTAAPAPQTGCNTCQDSGGYGYGSWHCHYSYWQYGRPTALVVPPNARYQSIYSWGVGQTRSVPIYHQFARPFPGYGGGGPFPHAPYWPSNTTQLGVYPVRAPF